MHHSPFCRGPGTSKPTENGYSSSSDNDDEERAATGLDAECIAAVKHMFRSSRPPSRNKKSSRKSSIENGVIVPFPQNRKASLEDEENIPPQVDVVRASILEFFFSTFPISQQDAIRTGLTHILITAGISPAIVFSKIYEPTRIKYVRMMYDQIARRRFANKMSDPSIDNRLTLDIPPVISRQLTRYNEDFEEIKVIGCGGFGKVYQSKSRIDGQFYAIKKIPLKRSTDKAYKKVLDECVFHASLHHPNIVRYHNAWVDQSYKTGSKPPSPTPQTVKIRSISTSLSDQHSTASNASSSIAFAAEDEEQEVDPSPEDTKAETLSTSSSDESKGKGFWAKNISSAGDVSFGSDEGESENDEIEEIEEEADSEDSELSDSSLDSVDAKKAAKILARKDYEDVTPKSLHLDINAANVYPDDIGYPTLFIQMELCHTTLEKYIRHREKQLLPIDPIFNELVFECLLSAVEFLHGHSVVHRDIKPSNIFIKKFPDRKPVIMLGDFGLARRELALCDLIKTPSPVEEKLTSGLGTYLYAAPEQLETSVYSISADIYSVGVVIYELYHDFKTGSERIATLMELRKTSQLSIEFQQIWLDLSPILSTMIERDPSRRHEAGYLLAALKRSRESRSEQTEIQRLTIENQRLKVEAELWKRKYFELQQQYRPHRGHGDVGDHHPDNDNNHEF